MKKALSRFVKASLGACVAVAVCALGSSAASNYGVVYDFTGQLDGANPASALVFDASGNAYGTAPGGGASGCGTVYKLTPQQTGNWSETTLYSFDCFAGGKDPHGGVTIGPGGNLYGTTVAGGSGICAGDGCGTVFEVTPKGESVLYMFTGAKGDGYGPGNAVVFDKAGNLYGMTPDGGKFGHGTVYELARMGKQWHERVIHNFTGGDGAFGSLGPILIDSSGNLYGVAELGGGTGCGGNGCGTAFKMSLVAGKWHFSLLYRFKGTPDAANPYGGLIMDGSGNLYGTTYYGGTGLCSGGGCGTVYELMPGHGARYTERVLYSFKGGTDGSYTTTTLVSDGAHLYGTTATGGFPPCDCGTVFKVRVSTGHERVIHSFGKRTTDGRYPYYGLTLWNGNLYSTTNYGGTAGQGTAFGIAP